MAEYIERTEELMLAMNAGARESCEDPQICPNCGKMFYDSTTKRKVYCSFDCQRTFCDRQAAQLNFMAGLANTKII